MPTPVLIQLITNLPPRYKNTCDRCVYCGTGKYFDTRRHQDKVCDYYIHVGDSMDTFEFVVIWDNEDAYRTDPLMPYKLPYQKLRYQPEGIGQIMLKMIDILVQIPESKHRFRRLLLQEMSINYRVDHNILLVYNALYFNLYKKDASETNTDETIIKTLTEELERQKDLYKQTEYKIKDLTLRISETKMRIEHEKRNKYEQSRISRQGNKPV